MYGERTEVQREILVRFTCDLDTQHKVNFWQLVVTHSSEIWISVVVQHPSQCMDHLGSCAQREDKQIVLMVGGSLMLNEQAWLIFFYEVGVCWKGAFYFQASCPERVLKWCLWNPASISNSLIFCLILQFSPSDCSSSQDAQIDLKSSVEVSCSAESQAANLP